MNKIILSILAILAINLLTQETFGQSLAPIDSSLTSTPSNSNENAGSQVSTADSTRTTGSIETTTGTLSNDQLEEIKDQLAEIKQIIKDNGNAETDEIGIFILKKSKDVQVYKYTSKIGYELTEIKVNIDSVIVLAQDGYIVDLQVVCGNKKFTNGNAPIAFSAERFNKIDLLVYRNIQTNEYIYLNEIFHFISKKPYIPEDDYFVLTPKENSHTLTKSVGLNSIFDLRLYTDALGVFGGKANGLIQTEANLKQYIHRKNYRNHGMFLPFSYFKFSLNASKFDSKVGFTDSTTFNRSSLLQKSWLTFDISFSAFHGWITKKSLSSYYGDFGSGINLSNIAKSLDTVTTISYSFFLEPGLDLKLADNIGTNISFRLIWNYSPQLDFGNQQTERLLIRPNLGMYWNPKGNKANRIFGRVTYTVDTRDEKNNYVQLQFGYSILLTSLVDK